MNRQYKDVQYIIYEDAVALIASSDSLLLEPLTFWK